MSSPNQSNGIAKAEAFLASLEDVKWLAHVGEPTEEDKNLIRLDVNFVYEHHANFIIRGVGDEYEYWGDLLLEEEKIFERTIFDQGLLGEQAKINSFIDKLNIEFDDDFYLSLEEKFEGYYSDTDSYAHELLLPMSIKRYLRGAACELLISDFDSSLHFYQVLIPWLRRGHWTYGWEGKFPEGSLMLF